MATDNQLEGHQRQKVRRLVREQETLIKLHTIWILLGKPPLPEHLTREWKGKQ